MKRIAIVCLTLSLLALPVFAEDGAALFKSKCVMCHAADGSGATAMGQKVGARDLRSDEVQKQDDAALMATVAKGRNKMPKFEEKLDAEQIKAVVAFIRTLKK